MTENKSSALTDAEIIKAQKLCGCTPDCGWCPYYDPKKEHNEKCYDRKNKDFDDHINRLQADKEALIAGQETLQKALSEKIAEVEKLKLDNEVLGSELSRYGEVCPKIRTEAIKELAERLKDRIPRFGITLYTTQTIFEVINNLVKEMAGEG